MIQNRWREGCVQYGNVEEDREWKIPVKSPGKLRSLIYASTKAAEQRPSLELIRGRLETAKEVSTPVTPTKTKIGPIVVCIMQRLAVELNRHFGCFRCGSLPQSDQPRYSRDADHRLRRLRDRRQPLITSTRLRVMSGRFTELRLPYPRPITPHYVGSGYYVPTLFVW